MTMILGLALRACWVESARAVMHVVATWASAAVLIAAAMLGSLLLLQLVQLMSLKAMLEYQLMPNCFRHEWD